MKNTFNKYGTEINIKNFLLEAFGIISGIILISISLKLKYEYIILIIICSLIIIPLLILAFIRQMNNMKRFSLLTDYLSNVIPIFIQKSKIRYTLSELSSITSDIMKEVIMQAIDYIDVTKNDPDMFYNALKIIENEFPNSRVKSVHKFLLTVEESNSKTYKELANSLYEDIEAWIKRTYTFQKELADRRNKIIVLCLMTLIMDTMFVYVYSGYDFFDGYTSNSIYQITTTIFVFIILGIVTIVLTKLNGEWLINDMTIKNEELLNNRYKRYKEGKKKVSIFDITLTVIFTAFGVYYCITGETMYGYVFFALAIIVITSKSRKYMLAKKYVNKAFTIEFPIWLREVSLSLENHTVLNAIESTYNMSSFAFRKELRSFLSSAQTDPTAIKPYNDFLIDYDLEDARSSMRVLFSLNNFTISNSRARVSNLIARNQTLLAKSEAIRNADSIMGIEAIGFIPIIVFCIQIMISMFIMFYYLTTNLGGLNI